MIVSELARRLNQLITNDNGHLEVVIKDMHGDSVFVKDVLTCTISYYGCGCNLTEKPHCKLI